MASLVQLCQGEPRRHELAERTTIGRDPACGIVVADPMVSLRHAEIRADAGRFRLTDLESRRGTFVGGKRAKEVELADGDELLIGVARFRFELSGKRHPEPPASGNPLNIAKRLALGEPVFGPVGEIEAHEHLRRDYEKLRAAWELARSIGVEHDLPALCERILSAAFELFAAERGAIVLTDPTADAQLLRIARQRDGKAIDFAFSTSLVAEVTQTGAGVLTADTGVDERFSRSASIAISGIRSAMCVPLSYRGEILGILHLDSRAMVNAFSERDLEICSTIAARAAEALKSAVLAKRLQESAARESRRVERAIEHLPSGVLLLDAERRVVIANASATDLSPALGIVRGERLDALAGLPLDQVLAEQGRPVDLVLPGPPARLFEVSAVSWDDPGAGRETSVVIRDVTEVREQKARSEQQDRMAVIGQLAGGVAHDFNNLLAVILNYSEFASEGAPQQVCDDVGQIREAALRAIELTRQLLAFSRREVVQPRVLEIDRLVGQMEKLLHRTLGEHITLHTSSAGELPRVKADPSKIEQVLLNLAVNARDAMPGGGDLRIASSGVDLDNEAAAREGLPPGRYARLEVRDSGVGMTPQVAARVFEPFFTTKEVGKGTGLGLATAYGVIRQAGGAISVTSQQGVGSSFVVLLPATDEPPAESIRRAPAPPRGKGTVLLVEDEAAVRRLTRRILEQSGYRVVEAANGREALARFEEQSVPLDLLLSDVVMPGISGIKLAELLRAKAPALRVLYMSGYVDEAFQQGGAMSEAQLLQKPFNRDELIRRVQAVLESGEGRPSG